MKVISFYFVMLLILFNAFESNGQVSCSLENIFPIKHGVSRFSSITTLAKIKNLQEDKEQNLFLSRIFGYETYDYLPGDSVLITTLNYDYINHPCFRGEKNWLNLKYADDRLYSILIKIEFSKTSFDQCIENYNKLIEIFKSHFQYSSPTVITNNHTGEQVGEGYWFGAQPYDKRDKVKIKRLSIEYKITYEFDFKSNTYLTGNVSTYSIEIEYINLDNTKLTNEGY